MFEPNGGSCPLCGSTRDKKSAGTWQTWKWWDCHDCGVAFVTPFKNPGASFYQEYEDLYPVEATGEPDKMSFEYRECLRSFTGDVSGKTLLDVGCGSGGFLNWARSRGFRVTGLDFDARRLDLVKSKLGIFDVHQGGLPEFHSRHRDMKFDVITMFQVLEHLDEPALWLSAAKALLAPGGKLFLGTPNRDRTFDPFQDSMAQVDNPPNHLTRWRAPALRAFVQKCGFDVVELKSLGVPLPLYALMLRNKLRFGLATKALKVDEVRHAAHAVPAPKAGLVRGLVKAKELGINALAAVSYPFFSMGFQAAGWQGVVLYCVARV